MQKMFPEDLIIMASYSLVMLWYGKITQHCIHNSALTEVEYKSYLEHAKNIRKLVMCNIKTCFNDK